MPGGRFEPWCLASKLMLNHFARFLVLFLRDSIGVWRENDDVKGFPILASTMGWQCPDIWPLSPAKG